MKKAAPEKLPDVVWFDGVSIVRTCRISLAEKFFKFLTKTAKKADSIKSLL